MTNIKASKFSLRLDNVSEFLFNSSELSLDGQFLFNNLNDSEFLNLEFNNSINHYGSYE